MHSFKDKILFIPFFVVGCLWGKLYLNNLLKLLPTVIYSSDFLRSRSNRYLSESEVVSSKSYNSSKHYGTVFGQLNWIQVAWFLFQIPRLAFWEASSFYALLSKKQSKWCWLFLWRVLKSAYEKCCMQAPYWHSYYQEKGLCAKLHGMPIISLREKIKKSASACLLMINHATVLIFCIIGHFLYMWWQRVLLFKADLLHGACFLQKP